MKNWFFDRALHHASKLAGQPGRILKLAVQISIKVYHTDFKSLKAEHLLEKVKVLGRMSSAYAKGHYRELPWKTFLKILAALLYFANPLDLVPDAIPGLGLTDDFTILVWVYSSAENEISRFLFWEKGLTSVSPSVVTDL